MNVLSQLYSHSLCLLTDLYELTMAYGYWKEGLAEREATFDLTFRKHPFGGEFAVACGLSFVVDWLRQFHFQDSDLAYLKTLPGADGKPLFDNGFLEYLRHLEFDCDLYGVPEGVPVFAHEPLIRTQGPLLQCQLVETVLLNLINFQTLVATKAARVCLAAGGDPVMDFGLRRAQGIDGGLAATRAAFVGGCMATSNVLAGKLYDIPVRGTHAHSWVMAFDGELESFRAYADALPNNCIFLVDTYDTLRGVRRAARVGNQLRQQGFELVGVRLDSGDLAELSKQARQLLNAAGHPTAKIVASSDLDEFAIARLKERGAQVDIWGVGTRLVTAYDQPALGGVYKLAALRDEDQWRPKIKLSEEPNKISIPGILQVRRFNHQGLHVADMIYDELHGVTEPPEMVLLNDNRVWHPPADATSSDLLVPVFERGVCVYEPPSTQEAQARTIQELAALPADVKRLTDATPYPVGLERFLHDLRENLIAQITQG